MTGDANQRRRVRPALLLVALVAAGLSACSSATPAADPDAPTVLVSGPGDGSGAAAQIVGTVTVDATRCVGIDGRLVIWPRGTSWDAGANGLRLATSAIVPLDGAVSGGGFYVHGTDAQAWLADDGLAGRCAWDGETAVFNPDSPVEPSP